jgi:hypothetical protein
VLARQEVGRLIATSSRRIRKCPDRALETTTKQESAASEDRVNTTNNTATGTFDFTAADGDGLWTTTVGAENEFVPPNVSKVTAAATIGTNYRRLGSLDDS